jgi:menaquinone-specific isochorismate synthase
MDEQSRETRSASAPTGRIAVRETAATGVSPGAFLRAFGGLPRGFWERGESWSAWAGSVARAALPAGRGGLARPVVRWRRSLGPEAAGRCYGGCAFDPAEGGRERWPAALFVLPAVELCRSGDGFRLAVRVRAPEGTSGASAGAAADRALERVLGRLEEADEEPDDRAAPAPGIASLRRRPGREGWRELVEAALEAVRSDELEKAVPARLVELEAEAAPDPVGVLERLRADNPGTFPFLVEPTPGTALVGAAPEIVASRRDECFLATAVAGTVPEGGDEAETRRLARRLRESAKDRAEHQLTVRDMREALVSVAGVARVEREPDVLRLRGMQHLITRLQASMPDRPHVLELLEALHPTAAVNGFPREPARAFLRRREPFRRGWFAGPVGWFDQAGDGTFAPALRCALLEGRRIRLFAGAGVVEGSRPDDEWRETGMKLRPALRALGLGEEEALVDGGPDLPAAVGRGAEPGGAGG